MSLLDLKAQGEAPQWLTEEGYATISGSYLLKDETPRGMYSRLADAAAHYVGHRDELFDIMWKGWLCPASPVLSNLGTSRGLPISCNAIQVGDSVDSIFMKNHELAMLSKHGAGVAVYMGDIRERGASIKDNGRSEGVIPWAKTYDVTTNSVSQGSTRRGATALYLPITHGDREEFLAIRRPTGDINRRCQNSNHAFTIKDDWMEAMLGGNRDNQRFWGEVLKTRVETGEPYLFFLDNANRTNPQAYINHGLSVKTSNLCCLGGDSMVLTQAGPQKIEDLVGKNVTIFDGLNWVKNSSFEYKGEDKLYRISLSDGSFVDANANHRWFAACKYTEIARKAYKEIHTDELTIGMWLESHEAQAHGDQEISAAYLKGFLLGDGTSTNERPLLWLYDTKYICAEALLSSAQELPVSSKRTSTIVDLRFGDEYDSTGTPGTWGRQKRKTLHGLSARKAELYPWAATYKTALPADIYTWSAESKSKLLAGLFDADGCLLKSGTLQLASVHLGFIQDIYQILKTFAYPSNIDTIIRPDNRRVYRLSVGPFHAERLLSHLPTKRIQWTHRSANRINTGWRRVVSIELLPGLHPVYCPYLPTTGKFALANGVMTGNSEISLHTDIDHSFVCCLSSMNLARWDEWKDTNAVELAIRFLDAVMSEYIEKSASISGLEASRRSAIKGRAIGLGALGWHTLLQERGETFEGMPAALLNAEIFKAVQVRSIAESQRMAQELGEPEWCVGTGMRHTHLLAIAPTVSNAMIAGGVSQSIEPLTANIYSQKSAKGTFIRKNPTLQRHLYEIGKDTPDIWKSITEHSGSVQHLKFLHDDLKRIFLTAREINQFAIVRLASQRQPWIDQAQSVNLFFANNSSPQYISNVHIEAWKSGLKSLYYLRSEGVLRGDLASRSSEECLPCQG